MRILLPNWVKNLRHKVLPRRLWARSLMIMIVPVILVQTIGCWVFFDTHWDNISKRLSQGIVSEIKVALSMYETMNTPAQKKEYQGIISKNLRFEIKFLPPASVPEYAKIKKKTKTADLIPALHDVGLPFVISYMQEEKLLQVKFYHPKYVAEVFLPYKYFFSTTTYVVAAWVIGLGILLIFVAMLFLRNQIKPIVKLAKAAENFGLGREVENFKPEGAIEVRQAAFSFIKMRDRITRYIEERTRMLAGVSHDLRTPLTRMRLQLSMMKNCEDATELLSDVDELERMVNAYLDFARGQGQEDAVETDIPLLISETLDSMHKDGVSVRFISNAQLKMTVRKNDFKRCIWNLVSNAQNYGTIVNVGLNVKERFYEITVEDNGPGIPVEKRNDVFKAFYRMDESRNTKTGGVGLGLAITKDIVLSHGGKIYMTDSSLSGLKVVMVFPI